MATTKWALDPTHSEIHFKVKHLMITTVTGSFKSFTAAAETETEDFSNASISFSADTASVDTGNEQRDGHLKSADFFDAEKFPTLSFVSTSYTKSGDDYALTGDLTIKDVTKSVTLAVEFGGVAKDPWGNTKAGFTLSGKINRKDFGLSWNAATETGGVLVSEEVKLLAEIQLVQQA
jgi:polyisoprenoid-binding protein YceI